MGCKHLMVDRRAWGGAEWCKGCGGFRHGYAVYRGMTRWIFPRKPKGKK